MKQFYCFTIKRHFRPLLMVIVLLLGRLAVNAQCYTYSLNAYQVSPSYIITSPTWVTLRAEMYNEFAGQDNMSWGRIYWYYQETGGEPFSMTEIGTNQWYYGSTVEFNATWNTTVWYCYYDYWTNCETVRIPYEFPYLTTTPPTPPVYINWEYGYVCGNAARFKVNSNATPVLYKQSALGGNNYDAITSSGSGYFEIPDYNPNTQYYVGASNGITSAMYAVSLDYYSNAALPVTGTRTILTGNTTTLSENSGNNYSNIRWYDAGGNLVYDGVPFTTPVLTANTTYSVRGFNNTPDGGTCVTEPSYVTIQVNQPPPPVTCDLSINIYQTSPVYALCYPQTVTLTAEMDNPTVDHDRLAWGAMNFYYQETGGTPFSSQEVYTNWYTFNRSVDVYANSGVTVWVSYKDYWTGCESPRIAYEFYISPTPYLYVDYAYACGNVAKGKVSSNAAVALYKQSALGGNNYDYIQYVGTGAFEITNFDAGASYYLMAGSTCSSGFYPISFDAFPTAPPAVTGTTTLPVGGSTILTADNGSYYDYRWYDAAGNFLHQGYQYTTPALTEDVHTYTVRSFIDGDICVSDPATVNVTVNLPAVTYSSLYNSSSFNSRTIDLGKAVGKIPGEAGTNGSGGATYNIPIYTPPGTNKMAPSIAVSYSSQAGNGVAGLGWNISGLSVIGRTGKDIYHNGVAAPVTLTDQDAFVLDGMRLNAVTGANGADGTIYAGENETWSQIISYGGSVNNPDWFKVIGKEGTIMEYGHSTDSRILTDDGANVIMWRLSRIIDINGNYVELIYNNGYRDSRIDEIKYTGNLNTNLAPYNSIKFSYKERTDAATTWSAGASFKMKHLLNNITVSNDNNLVKTYQFNYGYDYLYSMLKEVVETAYDGSSLNSTIFLYGDQQAPTLQYYTSDALTGAFDFFSGDFNADGKTDLLAANVHYESGVKYHTAYQLLTDLTESSATVLYMKDFGESSNSSIAPSGSFSNFLTTDYNGDGRDDVMHVQTSKPGSSAREFYNATINFTGSHNPGTGWTNVTSVDYTVPSVAGIQYKYIPDNGNFIFNGDFDGDGNKDYILLLGRNKTSDDPSYNGNYVYKAFLTNTVTGEINKEITNFFVPHTANAVYQTNSVASANMVTPFDFDGDGKSELLVTNNYGSYVVSISRTDASSGYSFTASMIGFTYNIYPNYALFPGDFNGDGKTDFLTRSTSGSWWLNYSTGKGFVEIPFSFSPGVSWSGSENDHKIVVSDFNGDGKSDILHGYITGSNASKFNIYYSNGTTNNAAFQKEEFNYDHLLAARTGAGFVSGDFNGDGRSDLMNRMNIYSGGDLVTFNANRKERLLSKIKDGYNGTYGFQYKLLTDKNDYPYFYNRTVSLDGPENAYPYNYIEFPAYAVSGFTRPNGLAGVEDVTTYTYENGILNRQGRGFLGYKKVVAKDLTTGITSTTESQLNTDYALLYPVKQTSRLTSTNALLKENTTNVSFVSLSTGANDPKRFMQKIDKTLSINYLTGAAVETVNTYGSYGNIDLAVKQSGTPAGSTVNAVERVTTATTWIASGTPVPSLPEQVTVTRWRNGAGTKSDVTRFTYTGTGLVSTKTDFYGLPKAVTTTFGHDGFGNVTSSTVSATGVTSRTTNITYDSKGRFAVSNVTAAGTPIAQTETRTYDGKWGKPLSSTASDCITTTYEYDVFGREKKATGPVFTVNYSLAWDVTGNNIYYGLTDYNGGKPDAKGWFDILGRETQKKVAGFNNQWLTNITTYDARGNVSTTTNSYYSNETPIVTTKQYDAYNRISQVSNSLNTITYTYSQSGGNLQITTTDQDGHATSKTTDAAGRVIASSDKGGSLSFTYDSRGLQTETKHGSTVVISNTYDDYGRKTSLTDKNAGTITYDYDALGQLKTETDHSNHTYQMAYDDLGRTISRQGPEGITTYEYYKDNTTGCSNNSLKKITGFNGVVKEFTYDNLMRPATEKITIDAVDYVTTTGYDTYSNVNKVTYPSGVEVNRVFDNNGHLTQVTGGNPGGQTTLFSASQKNGYGQYTAYILANNRTSQMTYENGFPKHFYTQNIQDLNFTWDYANRNLLSRQDLVKGVTENFQYDALNRLTQYAVAGQTPNDITYDGSPTFSMGNIATKTDAGNYTYRNDKIHAVAYITNPTAISNSTVGQVITYTPFLKAETISENDYQLSLTYGPDYQRVKSVLQYQNVVTETKIFAGEYEKFTDNTGTKEIHYIQGGNGLCAIIVRSNGAYNIYVTYTDYLGSVLTLTDLNGNVVAEQNFDPWGRKRNPQDWTYNNIPTVPAWLYRGFTGHEHLPQFALINMNGRLYDPVQGRMISPDVALGDVYNTQGYNRYSYANNNPLSYVDPDGNFILFAIGNVIAHAIRGDIHNVWDGFKYFGQGALAGIGSMVTGGLAQGVPVLGQLMAFANTIKTIATGVNVIMSLGRGIFTGDWTSLENANRLFWGQYYLDENKSFFGGVWEGISRNTFQFLQQAGGYATTSFTNAFGGGRWVSYYGGATALETFRDGWGGVAQGSFILGDRGLYADPGNPLFQHEYGHYVQSQAFGLLYYTKVGIPSLRSDPNRHDTHPAEQDANHRARAYFNHYVPGFSTRTANGWNYTDNPIIEGAVGAPRRIRWNWYDFIDFTGLINANQLNSQND